MKTSVAMLENTDLYRMKTGIVPRFPRPVMAGAISSAKKQICA